MTVAAALPLLVAAGAGVAMGWCFRLLFARVLPRGTTGRFWRGFAATLQELVAAEDSSRYFAVYGRMMRATGGYVGRSLLAAAVALLPVLLFAFAGAPLLGAWRDGGADRLLVYAAPDGGTAAEAAVPAAGWTDPLRVAVGGIAVTVDAPRGHYAWCSSQSLCVALSLLGLTPRRLDPAQAKGLVVARPDRPAVNPFWPYLDDPEFLFMAAMTVAVLWRRRRPVAQTAPAP